MSDGEKLTQKWAVAAFFDDLPINFEFAMDDNPLHTTLAGVFALPEKGDEIAKIIEVGLAGFDVVEIIGEQREQWGDGIEVTILRESNTFSHLYKTIQNNLVDNGAVFNEPQYLGDGFTPHVTKQKSGELAQGTAQLLKTVSLVDMFPNNNGYRRRIHANFRLGEHARD